MRIGSKLFALALLILVAAIACTGGSDDTDSESAEVTGPALVMFYTDN
jgi:hypothetical protein